MRRGLVAFSALTLVGLGLTGCGLFRFEQREPWRTQAEEACLSQQMVQPSAYMSRASKIDGPGSCGMDYPFKVAAFSGGSVGVKQKLTLACPIIPRIDTWLEEVVKPAATLYYGIPVVDLKAGSYSCRPRNNRSGAKTSEHAYGNAMDVMAFILADGREITVAKGWKGNPTDQEFLREVFVGACRHFTTVLGPGSDAFHYDHFHIDLARHDPRGERRICKPILKFAPRLDLLVAGAQAPAPRPAASYAAADLPPLDVEEEYPVEAEPAPPSYRPAPVAAPRLPPAPVQRPSSYPAAPPPQAAMPRHPAYPPAPQPLQGPYQAPVYNRPPGLAPPQVLNGHGLY
jgi:Extensin-like protein C-terminus